MEFHNTITQQAAWDELVHKLSSWKNLAFAYLKSIKDAEPHSDELFNAMKSANSECHMVLDKILKWILTNSASPDNGEIVELLSQEFIESLFPHQKLLKLLERQLLITPNECRIERPLYGSASQSIDLRSDIKINYETKTNHRIVLLKNLNRDSPNSNVPIQSKQLNSSSCYSSTLSPSEDIDFRFFTSHNPTVENTWQHTYQDQQKYDNKCTHSFVTKNQQQFRTPTNNYHETQHRDRNRSRSRSCNEQRCISKSTDSLENRHKTHHGNKNRLRYRSYNEQRCKSKSTDSLKKKQDSRDRTRKKSRTKSPKRRENVTKYKQESRDRLRKKSRSKSQTKSPNRKENVTKNPPLSEPNDHSPDISSKSNFTRILPHIKNQLKKRNKECRKLQEELFNIKEKMSNRHAGFHRAAFTRTSSTTTIKEIESGSEIEKIQGNQQQALIPVKPYYQNPDGVSKTFHPRTAVFVMRPRPPCFMPPRPRLRYPPPPLLPLPPIPRPIMYRPWHQ